VTPSKAQRRMTAAIVVARMGRIVEGDTGKLQTMRLANGGELYYRALPGRPPGSVHFHRDDARGRRCGRRDAVTRLAVTSAAHSPRTLISMGSNLNVDAELKSILGEVLSLGDRADRFTAGTALLGSLPELDSMAVVSLITTIEERFGIVVGDDEISAQTFETFGSLSEFVQQKLDA
ncbi:MAG: acyl carrier protein, partial [Burkholderiaceae bacterium]